MEKPTPSILRDWSKCHTYYIASTGVVYLHFDDLLPNGLLIFTGLLPSGRNPPKRLNMSGLDPLGVDVHIRETRFLNCDQWNAYTSPTLCSFLHLISTRSSGPWPPGCFHNPTGTYCTSTPYCSSYSMAPGFVPSIFFHYSTE